MGKVKLIWLGAVLITPEAYAVSLANCQKKVKMTEQAADRMVERWRDKVAMKKYNCPHCSFFHTTKKTTKRWKKVAKKNWTLK